MTRRNLLVTLLLAIAVLFVAAPTPALATSACGAPSGDGFIPTPTGSCPGDVKGEKPQCVDGCCPAAKFATICNYSWDDIQKSAIDLINYIFGIIGVIVLIFLMYGGFLWLISAGNTELIEKGKKMIAGSLIGLVIVFAAPVLVKFLLVSIGTKTKITDKIPIEDKTNPSVGGGSGTPGTPSDPFVCRCFVSGAPIALKSSLEQCFPHTSPSVANCGAQYDLNIEIVKNSKGFDTATSNTYMANKKCNVIVSSQCKF